MRMQPHKLTEKLMADMPDAVGQERKRNIIIGDVFNENLVRFLRLHRKQYYYERVYSKTFKQWEYKRSGRRLIKWLKGKLEYPSHVVSVVNIIRTLNIHYDYRISLDTGKLAYNIWLLFDDSHIYPYNYTRYVRMTTRNGRKLPSNFNLKRKKALKEQKARGFIHINDFEDYDRNASHVHSNVNNDYVWPLNCAPSPRPNVHKYPTNIYIAQKAVGVKGWTGCRLPKGFVVR